jgi:hypothetical protein
MLQIVLKLDQLGNIGLFIKKKYKKRSKELKSLNGFRIIWRNISKKVIEKFGKNLMERLRVKLRSVGYAGVMEPFKLPKI